MQEHVLDLQDYRTPGAKVFMGRDRGNAVREASKIDEWINEKDSITIRVPEDIYSIGVSFLEEFLGNVVTALGEEGFKKKFTFDNPGPYQVAKDVDAAVGYILKSARAPL